jgi:hypothetical protein
MNLQGKVYRMNSPTLKPLATGRFRRTAAVVALSGGILVGTAGAALAGTVGNNPGAVTLNPASGATSSKPTWSTTVACNPGFQGSAIFREVHADGVTTNSISPAVNGTAVPFSGTLQATMAQIQTAGGIATGGTQELVVICFSGPSLTGTSDNEMDTFVTYNADGTYSSSGTQPVPVGEIGGIALAGLAAIGLGFLQFRRIRSRRKQPVASA